MGSNRAARGLVRKLVGELDVAERRVRKLLAEAEAIVSATGPEDDFRRLVDGLTKPLAEGAAAIEAAKQDASALAEIKKLKAEASANLEGDEKSVTFRVMNIRKAALELDLRLSVGPMARSAYRADWDGRGHEWVPGDHQAFEKDLEDVQQLLLAVAEGCEELDNCIKDVPKIRI